eukprot:Polyplicarium_translucidae@DN2904_c0_g1_i1.p1
MKTAMRVCLRRTEVNKKPKKKPATLKSPLRANVTPGTILILLAGNYRGKRVVFLKELSPGTLLITGPFLANGVPLRRVNHRYVIATSAKVDVSGIDLSKFTSEYFKKDPKKRLPADPRVPSVLPKWRKDDQDVVDKKVTESVRAVPQLEHYLKCRFSLQ